jgi:hypothetical protein
MAKIRNFGLLAQLKSEASNHVLRYRSGRLVQSGRGLAFWFMPQTASIVEIPMSDQATTLFLTGRSQDFQDIAVQGNVIWHIEDPQRVAERIDFAIDLRTGLPNGQPIDMIESRIVRLTERVVLQYMAEAPVRALLDHDLALLQSRVDAALVGSPVLAEIGTSVVGVSLGQIAPTKELERALQTPTFEALQQKADQATFERRALAVEKERAIAENELANKIELARREKMLIAEETGNTRTRVLAQTEDQQIEAEAEAARIRALETARTDAERARIDIYRDLPRDVMFGLAAREFAGKLDGIEHLNVTPDLLAALVGEVRKAAPAAAAN